MPLANYRTVMNSADCEEDLIRRSVAGDQVAMGQLLLGYCNRLERHVAQQVPCDLAAAINPEDIFQQTCMRAFRAIGSFSGGPGSSFYGWLRTIADHLLKDAVRRRIRERLAPLAPPRPGTSSGSLVDLMVRVAGNDATPSQAIGRRDALRCMRTAMAGLSQEYREVIRLRYLEGRSIEEVARAMGRSVPAVRGLCYRARQSLREALGRSSAYFSK